MKDKSDAFALFWVWMGILASVGWLVSMLVWIHDKQ